MILPPLIKNAHRRRHAKGLDHGFVVVRDQGERKLKLRLERLLGLGLVVAHPKDCYSLCCQISIRITQRTTLRGAPGRIGLGIKINQRVGLRGIDRGQVDGFAGFCDRFYGRRGIANDQGFGF
jgi:hypothetical protein